MPIYAKKILPPSVAIRMPPEDLAAAHLANLSSADIVVTPRNERPLPNSLYVRERTADRRREIWYFLEDFDGRLRRLSTRRPASDLAGAQAWVIRRWLRRQKGARARLAPESMSLPEVLTDYLAIIDRQLARGEIKVRSYETYLKSIERLNRSFGNATIAEVSAGGSLRHQDWCRLNGFAQNTAVRDNTLLKVGVNKVLNAWGSGFYLNFHVGHSQPGIKNPFEPDEVDRIRDTAEFGTVYGADLLPLFRVDPETGLRTAVRVSDRALASFEPFVIGVPLSLETGTRSEAICEVTYVYPKGPFLDLDDGVLHRRGQMTRDRAGKRRAACVMSDRFMAWIRPRADAALKAGRTHVITDSKGEPLRRLSNVAWRRLLKAANVEHRTVHCLKDSAVQIARREGISIRDAAERFATTERTLRKYYGADWDLKLQIDPANAMGEQAKWRAGDAAVRERLATAMAARKAFEEGRAPEIRLRPRLRTKRAAGARTTAAGHRRNACPSGTLAREFSAVPWPIRSSAAEQGPRTKPSSGGLDGTPDKGRERARRRRRLRIAASEALHCD